MLTTHFTPVLGNGAARYATHLLVADGSRSAATIGETIVSTATRLEADVLVIASHGTCVPDY